MITIPNGKGFEKNECWVIVDKENHIVDVPTFSNNRRKSYYFSRDYSIANRESVFESMADANKVLSKCKRGGEVRKVVFENVDVSECYDGEGANILGFDFVNEKIWIESKDGSKYGYDYRKVVMSNN